MENNDVENTLTCISLKIFLETASNIYQIFGPLHLPDETISFPSDYGEIEFKNTTLFGMNNILIDKSNQNYSKQAVCVFRINYTITDIKVETDMTYKLKQFGNDTKHNLKVGIAHIRLYFDLLLKTDHTFSFENTIIDEFNGLSITSDANSLYLLDVLNNPLKLMFNDTLLFKMFQEKLVKIANEHLSFLSKKLN